MRIQAQPVIDEIESFLLAVEPDLVSEESNELPQVDDFQKNLLPTSEPTNSRETWTMQLGVNQEVDASIRLQLLDLTYDACFWDIIRHASEEDSDEAVRQKATLLVA